MRADLADAGIFVFTNMALRLANAIRKENQFEWISISTDLVNFMAKNQFKDKLARMAAEIATTEQKAIKKLPEYRMVRDAASRLDCLLGGETVTSQPKFTVKILAHIDSANSGNNVTRIQSMKLFKSANLEGQKSLAFYRQDPP